MISFDVSPEGRAAINLIVKRAAKIAKENGGKFDRVSCSMDLSACHANGTPMDFRRLAQADDFNIAHDVFGIARHLDRETGHLSGHFLPRFAKRVAVAA